MWPSSYQPTRLFATLKTHKFENFNEINIDKLKLRPIIDQTGTCFNKTGKGIAEYLKPLTKNEFFITNTQSILNKVPLSEDEEDISYDVESLFTNITIKETIDFICDEINNCKMLKAICKQSTFKKLLYTIMKQMHI